MKRVEPNLDGKSREWLTAALETWCRRADKWRAKLSAIEAVVAADRDNCPREKLDALGVAHTEVRYAERQVTRVAERLR